MSNEYTPTTEQVEDGYVHDSRDKYRDPVNYPANVRVHRRAFRRWLERVKAEAQVKALREAADPFQNVTGSDTPVFSPATADYLHARADRIAREAGIESKGESND